VGLKARDLELWIWELAPGDARDRDPHRPGTQEIVPVHRGRLLLTVDGTQRQLTAGRIALFDRTHRFEKEGRAPAGFSLIIPQPLHRALI
jgi:quercetin dioxygenase-like cupin family protein